ncbi:MULTISPECIES: hypothetical protein [unclassified Bradyrhizobium]|uniref:hypothetical protein n=1 Tax=unclassified Bradyrhizobium TaxID=2631580 RepID=UPI0028E3B90F|nr:MULTISPECIES: hypothetical protein [unclassified Bradyrhizobium]
MPRVDASRVVASIGTDAMAGAIGARTARTATRLVAFDLDAAKVASLVALGATSAAGAAAAAVLGSVDRPLSVGTPKAATGQLTCMVGAPERSCGLS